MQTDGSRSRRALILRVPGLESTANAHRLARTAELAGLSILMVPYWPDGERAWRNETPLLEKDIGSAPRLSSFAFEQRFEFDLDLIDLSLHLFATEAATPDTILPETVWKQRLRGVAATAIDLIRRSEAEIVFVPHGAEVISRILASVAAAMDRRLLFWESGFFPGHLYLDSEAPHFFRGTARIDRLSASHSASARSRDFRANWLAGRQSKYPQPNKNREALADWIASDCRPILFLPGQVPSDANAVVGLGEFDTLDALYQAVLDHVPGSWRVLYKPHPLTPRDPLAEIRLPPERFLRLDVDLHDALRACSAVLVHSSNVGLEALLHGKAVLSLGQPIYEGRGLTTHLDHPRMLALALVDGTASLSPPAEEAVLGFLDLLLEEALIADDDTDALLRRINQASPGALQGSRQCWYGEPVQALAEAARAIHEALRVHLRLDRALEALADEHRQVLESRVGLEALEPHRFGGPPVPRNRYAGPPLPDLDAYLDTAATYRELRLEDCIDPVTALGTRPETQVLRLPTPWATPDDAIQVFQEQDVADLVRRSGRTASICGFKDSGYLQKNSAESWIVVVSTNEFKLPEQGLATFRPWSIPLNAFTLSEGTQPLASGSIASVSLTRHPIFGPFIRVPTGTWQVRWHTRSMRILPRAMRKLRILCVGENENCPLVEWVEHLDSATHTLCHAPFGIGHLTVTARYGANYEFRFSLPSSRKSKSNVFAGFQGVTLWQESLSSTRD